MAPLTCPAYGRSCLQVRSNSGPCAGPNDSPHYNSSLRIHNDLLARIGPLLSSRNDQYPPETILATPDYALISQSLEENNSAPSNTALLHFDFGFPNTARPLPDGIEKRRHFGKRFEELVETSEASGVTNDSDCLDLDQSNSVRLSPNDMATIDQGLGDSTIGREGRYTNNPPMPTNTPESFSTNPQGRSQLNSLRFVLRRVFPDNPRQTELRPRPSVYHVPGSYKSEVNYSVHSGQGDPSQSSAVVGLSVHDDPQWAIPAAVYVDRQHEITEPKQGSKDLISYKSTPSRKSSLRSTGSAASARLHRYHGLGRSSTEPLISNEQLPPPHTFSSDQSGDHNEGEALLQPLPGIKNPVEIEKSTSSVKKHPTPPVSALAVIADGPRVSELLAQLPPLKKEVIDDFNGHHLTAVVKRNTQKVPLKSESFSSLVSERPNISNSPGDFVTSSVSSFTRGL